MAPAARGAADKQLTKNKKQNTNKKIKLKATEKQIEKFDIIRNLPLEISQKLLLLLRKNVVPSAYNCSSSWRNIMSGNHFWKKRCQIDNYHMTDKNKTSKYFRQYLKEFDSYWQGLYSYSHMLLNNWKNNNFKKTIRKGFLNNRPANIHYIDENVLIISTSKYNLKMLDSSTGNKINMKLGKHVRAIDKVFKFDNYLISYCYNLTFKVWDLSKNGLCITSRVVPGYIQEMAVAKNVIALVTNRPTRAICVYDFKGILMYRRNINAEYQTCTCLNDKILAIATENGEVDISEFNSETSRNFIAPEGIKDIKIKSENFLCILYPTCIRVYDTRTLRHLHEMKIWKLSILGYMEQDKIVCNNGDNHLIIVWNLTTGHRILQIKNQYVITYLTGNSQYIITYGRYKKMIKIWSYDKKQEVTKISLKTIGLKDYEVMSARITTSKLVLLCYKVGYDYFQHSCIVLLNFENTKNIMTLIRNP